MIIVIIYRLDSGGRHDISHQHRAQEWRPADAADLRCHHRLGASGLGVSERTGRSERGGDRKSTRLNSSHVRISYAVFCLKKKKKKKKANLINKKHETKTTVGEWSRMVRPT